MDISESGISAMLRMEVPLGELVELDFTLPFGPVTILCDGSPKERFFATASSSLNQTPCTNLFVAHAATLLLTNPCSFLITIDANTR